MIELEDILKSVKSYTIEGTEDDIEDFEENELLKELHNSAIKQGILLWNKERFECLDVVTTIKLDEVKTSISYLDYGDNVIIKSTYSNTYPEVWTTRIISD